MIKAWNIGCFNRVTSWSDGVIIHNVHVNSWCYCSQHKPEIKCATILSYHMTASVISFEPPLRYTWDPFYWHGLSSNPAWISHNWININISAIITYGMKLLIHSQPFSNFHCATVEVWEWLSTPPPPSQTSTVLINFTPRFIGHVITYPCSCISWAWLEYISASGKIYSICNDFIKGLRSYTVIDGKMINIFSKTFKEWYTLPVSNKLDVIELLRTKYWYMFLA